MSRGWKALEEEVVDGWMCRFSDGVTRRANSVLPLGEPAGIAAAIAVIERFYAARGLPAVFQISADSLPRDLDDVLAKRGYAADSPTVVQLLGKESLAVFAGVPADRRVVLSDRPSPEWLQVHWDVEGPQESAKQEANRKILENTPSVYAALVVGERIESVARMALVADLGGIYCVATRPESRSRGYARTVWVHCWPKRPGDYSRAYGFKLSSQTRPRAGSMLRLGSRPFPATTTGPRRCTARPPDSPGAADWALVGGHRESAKDAFAHFHAQVLRARFPVAGHASQAIVPSAIVDMAGNRPKNIERLRGCWSTGSEAGTLRAPQNENVPASGKYARTGK